MNSTSSADFKRRASSFCCFVVVVVEVLVEDFAVELVEFVRAPLVVDDAVLTGLAVIPALAAEGVVEVEEDVDAVLEVVTFFGGNELRLEITSAKDVADLLRSGRSGGALLSESLDELLSLL